VIPTTGFGVWPEAGEDWDLSGWMALLPNGDDEPYH